MDISCKNCNTNINKPDISKYNNFFVCLNCYIYLTGIVFKGFKNENQIIDNVLRKIEYKNDYFNFFYKLENEFNYNKRVIKFQKLNKAKMYNNGWMINNKKTKINSVYIHKDINFITFLSISCVYVYSIKNKTLLKLYDFVDLKHLRNLIYFTNNKLMILKPFLHLYID